VKFFYTVFQRKISRPPRQVNFGAKALRNKERESFIFPLRLRAEVYLPWRARGFFGSAYGSPRIWNY